MNFEITYCVSIKLILNNNAFLHQSFSAYIHKVIYCQSLSSDNFILTLRQLSLSKSTHYLCFELFLIALHWLITRTKESHLGHYVSIHLNLTADEVMSDNIHHVPWETKQSD